ncbi:MAG: (2Fe-2S)-binding protein [Hyphomicrobiaceae bacterium]
MTGNVTIMVNGTRLRCAATTTVAAALLANGHGPGLRKTEKLETPRGLFCGMGLCYDCLVTIDGRPGQRACMTPVSDGMRIETP